MGCLLALILCAVPATASAGGVRLGAEFGYTRHMRGGDLNGLGGIVYVGQSFASGLVLDGQVGVHHNWHESGWVLDALGTAYLKTRLQVTSVPILVGGRYHLPGSILVPYLGAHVGVAAVRSSGSLGDINAEPDLEVDFAFNLGAGIDVAAGEKWAVGFGVWYLMILAGETEQVAGVGVTRQHDRLVTLTLHVRFDL